MSDPFLLPPKSVVSFSGGRTSGYMLWRILQAFGVSCEDQEAANERIPHLLKVPASVRFLSCEPLLNDVNLRRFFAHSIHCELCPSPGMNGGEPCQCPRIGWVIVGGESGRNARPCDLAWIRSIRDQCRAAGVKFFLKQVGSKPVDDDYFSKSKAWFEKQWGFPPGLSNQIEECRFKVKDSHGSDPSEWPADLRDCREIPTKGGAM